MPLPEPRRDEKESEFIDRCMASEAAQEFKDEKQRLAVCYSQFKKKDAKASHPEMQIQATVAFDLEGEQP
jgi:hypothetical protein